MGGLGICCLYYFYMDISLNSQHKCLKFCLCEVPYHIEGTVTHDL